MTISNQNKPTSSRSFPFAAAVLALAFAAGATACLTLDGPAPRESDSERSFAAAPREGTPMPSLNGEALDGNDDNGGGDARPTPPREGTPLPSFTGDAPAISAGFETITTYYDDAAHSNVVGECEARTCPPKGRTCWGIQTAFKTVVSIPCQ